MNKNKQETQTQGLQTFHAKLPLTLTPTLTAGRLRAHAPRITDLS